MPKFKFKFTDRKTPEGFWETANENRVTNQSQAEQCVAQWIESFNRTEQIRYGEKGCPRTVVEVVFIGDGPTSHEYEKKNAFSMGGDGHGTRDKWVCKNCGCTGLRYGLSAVIKRTGKWRAKKYEFCSLPAAEFEV